MVQHGNNSHRLPLHLMISEKLREQIDSGSYTPGDQLPSEFDLSTEFNVSRTTVRKAIANLIHQGLVFSQQGKGVFVKQRHKVRFLLSNSLTFFDHALIQQGLSASIQSIRFEVIHPPRTISHRLHLPQENSLVYRQQKIILADKFPIALDISYFPLEIGEKLKEHLQHGFTYTTLERNGFELRRADVALEGTHATHEIGAYLDAALGTPLLVYRYTAYGIDHRPVVCGETLSCADRTYYAIEFTAPSYHHHHP